VQLDVAALVVREGETAVYAVSLAGRVPPGAVARVELSFDTQRLRVEPSVLVFTGALAGSAQTVAVSAREDLTVAGASGTHGQPAIAHTLELRAAAADAGRGLLASSHSQHQPLELQRELLHVLVLDDDGDVDGAELLVAPRNAWLATAGAEATYTLQLSGTTGRALRQDDRAYPVRVVPSVRAGGACAESGAACDPSAPAPQEACARCVPLGPAATLIEVEPAWALLTRANDSEPVQFRVRARSKSPLARSLLGAARRCASIMQSSPRLAAFGARRRRRLSSPSASAPRSRRAQRKC
jgi:hypothetical protein